MILLIYKSRETSQFNFILIKMTHQRLYFSYVILLVITFNLYFQSVHCESNEENYPYHVSIRYNGQHVCSGSIITKRYILTTKKCITRYSSVEKLSIIAGTNSLITGGDTYAIEKIIKHNNSQSDIALLLTCNDICFTETIHPIGISMVNNAEHCDVVKITAFKKPPSGMPKTVKLQAYNYEICNDFQCRRKNNYFDNMFICLMKCDRTLVCNTDFGGAIVANNRLIGIKLYGGPCVGNKPELHLYIYPYLNWINDNIIDTN